MLIFCRITSDQAFLFIIISHPISLSSMTTASMSSDHSSSSVSHSDGSSNKKRRSKSNSNKPSSYSTAGATLQRISRSVLLGRILFVTTLCAVAAVLGFLAFFLSTQAERTLAETEWESIADRALNAAHAMMDRKLRGTVSMASIVGNVNPDIQDWPKVVVPGYEEMATNLIATSDGREMGFAPIVRPDQLEDFEEFAYRYYEQDRDPQPFPPGTAVNSFGKGVFGVDPDCGSPDKRYRITPDWVPPYETPNRVFMPILHHNAGPHPALMLNLGFEPTRGKAFDAVIACSEQRAAAWDPNGDVESAEGSACALVSDMLILTSQEVEPGPGALMIQPIFPRHNKTSLAGFLASSIVWDEVLKDAFASGVNGVDCVLETETQVYTYTIQAGRVLLKGEGDLHSRRYNKYSQQDQIVHPGEFSQGSAMYTLTLYPTAVFFDTYSTRNPISAAVGAVAIIAVISLLFFLYDFFVRREVNARKALMEAKRRFVRFVSHEVRTPLNSVCMGLTLLKEEMEASVAKTDFSESTSSQTERNWLTLTDDILASAQSSVDVLNDLLNYDKIEMGTLKLELTVIPIWNLIESTTKEFLVPAAKKKIALSMRFKDGDSKPKDPEAGLCIPKDLLDKSVVGDEVRITQVLRNLISNALKFTSEEGSITIEASFQANGTDKKQIADEGLDDFVLKNGNEVRYRRVGTLQVSVTDTGAGLSPEQLDRLFQDGVQFNVNELQAGQGSGLGLFIAKGIMVQHQGSLQATSQGLGKGTTFVMTLPLHHVPQPDKILGWTDLESRQISSMEEEEGEEDTVHKPLKILVVDDAKINRKLLCRLLRNHGHECEEAEDGQVAVDKIQNNPSCYDTILLDFEMPVLNGPDAAHVIRHDLRSDVFVVGITGNVMNEDVELFMNQGANAVLPKPLKLEALEQLWRDHGLMRSKAATTQEQPCS